jgi:hypothetical protein
MATNKAAGHRLAPRLAKAVVVAVEAHSVQGLERYVVQTNGLLKSASSSLSTSINPINSPDIKANQPSQRVESRQSRAQLNGGSCRFIPCQRVDSESEGVGYSLLDCR